MGGMLLPLLGTEGDEGGRLEQQLVHQVHQADSYLQPYRRLFLCCQSEYVKHCCMGYLQVNMPYAWNGQDAVEGCLVLLVPEKDATGAAAYLLSLIHI